MIAFHRCPNCTQIREALHGADMTCGLCRTQSPLEPQTVETLTRYLAQSVAMEAHYKDKLDREVAERRGYASSSAFAAEHQVAMRKHAKIATALRTQISRLTKS